MKTQIIKTRFAPSPTGLMHFGNVRTALFNYLYAKKMGGNFLLRIEDTDKARSEKTYLDSLLTELVGLGIHYDEGPYFQSEREAIYTQYFSELLNTNKAYLCFCSEETLDVMRKVQLAAHQPPRYAGPCPDLTQAQINEKLSQGLKPALRFRVEKNQTIEFKDLIKGPQSFKSNDIGDFIIRRQDGAASFMFCNAIDDSLMQISHALRGDDHLTNTPRQLMILKSLNLPSPNYGHFPMIIGADGTKLSKRNGSRSINELKKEGYLAEAILNYLASLGHHFKTPKFRKMEELIQDFELEQIAHSPANFDLNFLNFCQKEAINHADEETFEKWVDGFNTDLNLPENKQDFLNLIKPNIIHLSDVIFWKTIFYDENFTTHSDAENYIKNAGSNYYELAIGFLKSHPEESYTSLINYLKEHTQLKGKALFMPLRVALTGQVFGPELDGIYQFLGNEKLIARLKRAKARA
ncbi:MAG: glutamyl-tRNA synthetase [Francisellaceae bacterium]|nr:glutamyl-tRNA synthetase [Francisellaceae bacterium]